MAASLGCGRSSAGGERAGTATAGRAAAPLGAVALLAGVGGSSATEALAAWTALGGPAPLDVGTAVVAGAATAAAAVALWLALGTLASTLALLAGRRRRPALVPAAVHRGTALLLGVSLAAGAGAAAAAPPMSPPVTPVTSAPAAAPAPVTDLDPAWTQATQPVAVPDVGWRPAPPPAPPRTVDEPIDPVLLTGRHHPPDDRHLVTVRRGDTLWDLAARGLGPDAADAEVAAEWPRWYAANRDVVGADPDLLLPGQQLVPPDG
jgi:nucleoid-associated protein YgaU